MSFDSFEDIVAGQFPLEEWFAYDLHRRFPLLEPNSELGHMAIRLEREMDEARDEYQSYREDLTGDDDPGWVIYEDEIAASGQVLTTAFEKRVTFHSIYQHVWQAFDPRCELSEIRAESKKTGKSLYEIAVDMAITDEVREANRGIGMIPEAKRQAQIKFIREAGVLYILEEGMHNLEAAVPTDF